MTARIKAFTVILDQDIREDDFEEIKKTFFMIKHVSDIVPIERDGSDFLVKAEERNHIRKKLYEFIKDNL